MFAQAPETGRTQFFLSFLQFFRWTQSGPINADSKLQTAAGSFPDSTGRIPKSLRARVSGVYAFSGCSAVLLCKGFCILHPDGQNLEQTVNAFYDRGDCIHHAVEAGRTVKKM